MKIFNLLQLAVLGRAFILPDSLHADVFDDEQVSEVGADQADVPIEHLFDSHRNAAEYFKSQETVDNPVQYVQALVNLRDYSKPRPGHPGHHHKPNQTVYELIAQSNYTTVLAKLINEYDDLVHLLNSTKANFTVFAPVDKAFKHIHGHKPSKDQIKRILTYHVSDEFYPVSAVLGARTIPTLVEEDSLGKGNVQRLTTNIGLFKGLTVNFYSRVIAVNIFGTNGVIHGVDKILVPPPSILTIVDLLPSAFSTLTLGLAKTGLDKDLAKAPHAGATLFAPYNGAWAKLGPRVNAFLFSPYGRKYLKALLKYHVVLNHTLYSDAYYHKDEAERFHNPPDDDDLSVQNKPRKGVFHVDLPTLLGDHTLSIDIARWGRFIEIKINAFARVDTPDGVAKDGVIHALGTVLIPPKSPGRAAEPADGLQVDDLIERLQPYVDAGSPHGCAKYNLYADDEVGGGASGYDGSDNPESYDESEEL